MCARRWPTGATLLLCDPFVDLGRCGGQSELAGGAQLLASGMCIGFAISLQVTQNEGVWMLGVVVFDLEGSPQAKLRCLDQLVPKSEMMGDDEDAKTSLDSQERVEYRSRTQSHNLHPILVGSADES